MVPALEAESPAHGPARREYDHDQHDGRLGEFRDPLADPGIKCQSAAR